MLDLVWGCALTAAGLAGAEGFARWRRWPEIRARKLVHVAAAASVIGGALMLGRGVYIWVGLVFFGLMAASRLLPDGSLATLSKLRGSSWGEVCFPLGVAGAAWLAPDLSGFLAAVLTLGLADTAAALAGRRRPRPGSVFGKTWAGHLAFLAVAWVILAAFAWPSNQSVATLARALATAAAAAVAEGLSPRGTDNVTVPVIVAVFLGPLN
ncbi:MAG: hypothetical protein LBO20_03790 [Bifidobacteriaceae bacterium]|jgi:dolichol kinase|nr:hypothetical protein [Bifidobacteriaceae bacterium]